VLAIAERHTIGSFYFKFNECELFWLENDGTARETIVRQVGTAFSKLAYQMAIIDQYSDSSEVNFIRPKAYT